MSFRQKTSNLLIVGCHGYLGSHYYRFFEQKGYKVIGTTRKNDSDFHLDLSNINVEFLDSLDSPITHALICAATPNIVKCQASPRSTFLENVLGTANLVYELDRRNIKTVVFSSDVVFDGQEKIYMDDSVPSPLNEYGHHKALLESIIPRITENRALILRLTKTYSTHTRDNTILFEIARKLLNGEKIRAASDLKFNPVNIDDILKATVLLLESESTGLFNICGPDTTSWYDLSLSISKALEVPKNLIEKISIDQLQSSISRAKHIDLRPHRLLENFPTFIFTPLERAIEESTSLFKNSQTI